jgi:hypothetical protein
MATRTDPENLEQELATLLEVERFDPPEGFREEALWSRPSVYPSPRAAILKSTFSARLSRGSANSSSRRCSNGNR